MPPNIVVLLLDAARAGHFSCYGHERKTTPFVDELAREGTLFERAYANSIYSLPSYGSLFTGEYPTEHGAIDWSDRIDKNVLVEGLRDAGYWTQAVSTHLVSEEFGIGEAFDAVNQVFVDQRDLPYDDDPVAEKMAEKANREGWNSELERYTHFLKLLARHPSHRSVVNGWYQLVRKIKKSRGWWEDDGGRAAIDEAKRIVDRNDRPFFLFVNFVETHDPYRPPREFIRRFMPEEITMDEIKAALDYSSVRASLGLDERTDRQQDILRRLYDAEIAYVDSLIRELYEHFDQSGLTDETVFVVTADHGDYFGEHGLWGHQGRIHTEVCHVPLVISTPWNRGGTVAEPVELRQLCSYLQTVAHDETSLLEPTGEALVEYYGWDTQLSFAPWEEYTDVDPDRWGVYQCSLIDDRYKFDWDAAGREALYDLSSAPPETMDISSEKPAVAKSAKERIKDLVGSPRDNHDRYRGGGSNREFVEDDAVARRLENLGYRG